MFKGQISRHTITIHELLENGIDIGLKDYAIFNDEYRAVLNNAIIETYRFREIGFSNPALFINRLNYKMDLIMRNKYNALYEAKATKFNPLYNIEIKETYSHEIANTGSVDTTNNSNSTSNTSSNVDTDTNDKTTTNSNALNLSSSFPSEELTEDDLTDNLFVDNASKQTGESENKSTGSVNSSTDSSSSDKSNSTSNQTSNGKQTETYTKFTEGSSAGLPFSKALLQLKEFYEKYRLDEQVCEELSDLFMSVY